MDGGSCHPGVVPYDFFPSLSLKKDFLLSAKDMAGTGWVEKRAVVFYLKGYFQLRNCINQYFLILISRPKQNQI